VIKLQIVIPTLDRSGAEKQFALLAAGLPSDEFEVQVVTLNRLGPYAELLADRGIPVLSLEKRFRLDPRTIWQLRREMVRFSPQVVLSCLFSANAATRLATRRWPGHPRILISERCVDSWKSGWQLALDRWLQPATDRLIANSGSVADFYAGQGFPRDRMTVIPNGVTVPRRPEWTRQDLLRAAGLPEDAWLAAYVGRLAPQKNLKTLIWSMQLLRQAAPRVHLLLIGDGPQRDDLMLYAQDVEVRDHVHFLGHRPDAASLLHLIDVFWLGSEFEGMSNSLMEAMACGRPVIVSDIPPNRELVRHGTEGWLVSPHDSMGFAQFTQKLLQEPELGVQLGTAGATRMQSEFSMDAMIGRYAALIREQAAQAPCK
jgi:glycosyltransferase involved in cell wall biosynthesis